MKVTRCKSAMDNCQNLEDSYGMFCVGCNCCGRFGTDTMWKARYKMVIRRLSDEIDCLTREDFKSNLQQKNICSNISYWSERLKEILSHIDFDTEKGADDAEQ